MSPRSFSLPNPFRAPSIAVMGAGELGRSLATAWRRSGHVVTLWDRDPKKMERAVSLPQMVEESDMVVMCIPSWTMSEGLEMLIPHVPTGLPVIVFAKGVEEKTRRTMDELCGEMLRTHPWALAGGPMLAEEVAAGSGGWCMVASHSPRVMRAFASFSEGSGIRVTKTDDVHGVALSSVLKNVYALSLGIAEGLELSGNAKGALASFALTEMMQMVIQEGGRADTVLGMAGVGDFIATGFSDFSRNHAIGVDLVRTGTCKMQGEGCVSLQPLRTRIAKQGLQMPLFEALAAIFLDHANPKKTLTTLLG